MISSSYSSVTSENGFTRGMRYRRHGEHCGVALAFIIPLPPRGIVTQVGSPRCCEFGEGLRVRGGFAIPKGKRRREGEREGVCMRPRSRRFENARKEIVTVVRSHLRRRHADGKRRGTLGHYYLLPAHGQGQARKITVYTSTLRAASSGEEGAVTSGVRWLGRKRKGWQREREV